MVFSEKLGAGGTSSTVATQIILENVRVLAVGKRISEKEEPSVSQDGSKITEDTVEYISVTLELKPADAVKLINTDERGNLKLILRGNVSP